MTFVTIGGQIRKVEMDAHITVLLIVILCFDVVVMVTDITYLYREIRTADLSITGGSCEVKRTTLLRGATLDVSRYSSTYSHLLSLRRSLKVYIIIIIIFFLLFLLFLRLRCPSFLSPNRQCQTTAGSGVTLV